VARGLQVNFEVSGILRYGVAKLVAWAHGSFFCGLAVMSHAIICRGWWPWPVACFCGLAFACSLLWGGGPTGASLFCYFLLWGGGPTEASPVLEPSAKCPKGHMILVKGAGTEPTRCGLAGVPYMCHPLVDFHWKGGGEDGSRERPVYRCFSVSAKSVPGT
jgi:hypothetical protein